MGGQRRIDNEIAGDREARRVAATLGEELRKSRRVRRMTQAQLASRIGIKPTRVHELEVGEGWTAPLSLWFAVGSALGRPFAAGFSRDLDAAGLGDAGHLAGQELLLKLSRSLGRIGRFEVSTRPSERDSGSVDVGLRDDLHRALILVEIWNRTDDLGRATRTSRRKVVETTDLAEFRGDRVASCWLMVDTAANRELVRRYPEVLRAEFTGSSAGWVRCLVDGARPPAEPGIAWIDPRSGTITPLRLRGRP